MVKIPKSYQIKKGWDLFSSSYVNKIEYNTSKCAFDIFKDLLYNYEVSKDIKQNAKIIDIGCGSGNFSEQILEEFNENIDEITLIDISEKMTNLANLRLNKRKNVTKSEISILNLNAENLSDKLNNNHFDYVFCNLVFHLVENPDQLSKEIHKILKPSGKAIITVLEDYQNSSFFNVFYDLLKEFGYNNDKKYRSIFHMEDENYFKSFFLKYFNILAMKKYEVNLEICNSFSEHYLNFPSEKKFLNHLPIFEKKILEKKLEYKLKEMKKNQQFLKKKLSVVFLEK